MEAARRFLSDLARFERGLIVLANMAGALKARVLSRAQCHAFLQLCSELHVPSDTDDGRAASEALDRAISQRWKTEFFRRRLKGETEGKVALVMRYEHFFPAEADIELWASQRRLIFTKDYIRSAREELSRADADSRPHQAMRDIAIGFRKHLDPQARLGSNEFVVFVTQASDDWIAALATGYSAADEVRNRLGLPYRRNSFLIELRSNVSLQEITGRSIRRAAPTVLEAWRCEFFRQVPDTKDRARWGRTVHLLRLSSNERHTDGAPEAIIATLPIAELRDRLDLSPAGFITSNPPATVRMHWDRLSRGRTADQLIEEILQP
jgi:hypothetical protein